MLGGAGDGCRRLLFARRADRHQSAQPAEPEHRIGADLSRSRARSRHLALCAECDGAEPRRSGGACAEARRRFRRRRRALDRGFRADATRTRSSRRSRPRRSVSAKLSSRRRRPAPPSDAELAEAFANDQGERRRDRRDAGRQSDRSVDHRRRESRSPMRWRDSRRSAARSRRR